MAPFRYTLVRSHRRTTAAIRVTPEGKVIVAAPAGFPRACIERMVRDKAPWICSRLSRYSELRAQWRPATYLNGEPLSYLEHRLPLRMIEGKDGAACLRQGSIHVPVPDGLAVKDRRQHVIRQLVTWYRTQALCHLQQQSTCFAERLGVFPALVGIKGYRSRWGTCHADGRIYFNWRIIMAPPAVVDYVVAHELCHLVHPNHAPPFWALVASVKPNYREARAWLREHGPFLHATAPDSSAEARRNV